MVPSIFQKNIYTEVEHGTGHLMVNAVAGSGKTTTLLEAMKLTKGNCLFLAFNKSIANELGKKVPAHVQAMTLHSIGLKIVAKNLGKVVVDNYKIDKLMNAYQPTAMYQGMVGTEYQIKSEIRQSIKELVSISKATLVDYNSDVELGKVADYYGIDYDPSILRHFRFIMNEAAKNDKTIDFDDMIYLPVSRKMGTMKFDYIFVDECQDLNRSQIELVLALVKPINGRIFMVGDPKQSIYGFRGADTKAMERMKETLQAKELPLSICYRCPTSHIAEAQKIVPYIMAREGAPEGTIEQIDSAAFVEKISAETIAPICICRINAPLVKYALMLISNGKKAIVRGADIGKNLANIIKNTKATNMPDLYDRLSIWEAAENEKLNRRRAAASAFDIVKDKAEVIRVIADECQSIECVLTKLNAIFSDELVGVVLSTVHRAKGLENDNIFIIAPHLLPLVRKDQQEWEAEQEQNILYVALTRAKNKIVYVNEPKKD